MKRLLTCVFTLLVILMFTLLPEAHATQVATDMEWSYNKTTKALTISGTGDMDDSAWGSHGRPWREHEFELQRVIIKEGITSIGDFAFADCVNLRGIEIPDSVTTIGVNAFRGCDNLEKITIPGTVKTIENHAFYSCERLRSVTLKEGVTSIGNGAFDLCVSLETASLADSITFMGDSVFQSCSSLKTVNLPRGISEIPFRTFTLCKNLTQFTFPTHITSIGNEAFSSSGLTSITIPPHVTQVGTGAFSACSDLKDITLTTGLTTLSEGMFRGTAITRITIPDSITSISTAAFAECGRLESITIPDSVTSIGPRAFYWCSKLEQIDLPKNITVLEEGVLGYSGLTSFTIPQGVTTIGTSAFGSCFHMESITIPDSVTEIGWGAFNACLALKGVTISDSVTTIGNSAFSGCTSLKEIVVPDSVVSLGSSVFSGCTILESVTLPNGLTAIPAFLLDSCEALKQVTIPTGVTEIGESAFCGCLSLSAITLPQQVNAIGNNAFSRCESLRELVIPADVTVIPRGLLSGCTSLASVTIPDGVTEIGSSAFADCVKLTELDLPESLKTIGNSAFHRCTGLTELIVPAYVDQIDFWFILECANLEKVVFTGHAPQLAESVFSLYSVNESNADAAPLTVVYSAQDQSWTDMLEMSSYRPLNWAPSSELPVIHREYVLTEGEATCTLPAGQRYSCVCGDSYTEGEATQEALGHSFGDPVPLSSAVVVGTPTTHMRRCTRCGEIEVIACTLETQRTETTLTTMAHTIYDCALCGFHFESWGNPYRVSGENRFETAFNVADEMRDSLGIEMFDTIIVASGLNFADALSGSYLAAVKNAPILLSFNEEYNDRVKYYIKDNLKEGGTVYILGGTSAVPASMEEGLDAFNITRLAGSDRFETNLAILAETGVADKDILVCTGISFADSLSASACEKPILLVWKDLTENQKRFLDTLENNKLYVIGGESAVSKDMESQVAAYGTTERVAGGSRFETSVKVAEKFFEAPKAAVLAYAWNYPDGLCGGALAAALDVPLILTMNGYGTQADAYTQKAGITGGTVLGGVNLIDDTLARDIFLPGIQ